MLAALKFLVGPNCNTFFVYITIKLYCCKIDDISSSNLEKITCTIRKLFQFLLSYEPLNLAYICNNAQGPVVQKPVSLTLG